MVLVLSKEWSKPTYKAIGIPLHLKISNKMFKDEITLL